MLTPRDLYNPRRASGYDHVLLCDGTKPYIARVYGGDLDSAGRKWQGPRRSTPTAAAQDYCDYANGHGITPSVPRYPDVSIDMGGSTRHAPKPEPVKVVRPRHTGKHDVYDVLFMTPRDDIVCRKIGITATGTARYADVCKTLGLSIKPFAPAVTFPSEAAAKVAEDARIAEVDKSDHWRRVAREAFAPRGAATTWVHSIADTNFRKAVAA